MIQYIPKGKKVGVRVWVPGVGKVWIGSYDLKKEGKTAGRKVEDATDELSKLPKELAIETAKKIAKGEKVTLGSGLTCEQASKLWIERYPRPKKSTNLTNKYALNRFVENFGERDLGSISRPEAREFALKHRSSVQAVRTMYNDLIRDEYLEKNPFSDLNLPQSRGRKDLIPLTPKQVGDIADCAAILGKYELTARAVVFFAAYTGCRPAETFALEREHLGKNTVTIYRSISAGETSTTKSYKPKVIALPKCAREAIDAMPRQLNSKYVFTSKTGKPLTRVTWNGYWQKILANYGNPDIDFYELRHFCASYLVSQGLHPKVVAHQLGHQDGGTLVMERYGHLYEGAAVDAVLRAVDQDNVRQLRSTDDPEGRKANG